MVRRKRCSPVCLFAGFIAPGRAPYREALGVLSEIFGQPVLESVPFDFDPLTSYYRHEMGTGLRRFFAAFPTLVSPGRLASVKVLTNRMEGERAVDGRRRVNIDPGYLDEARVVLASAKDFSHRVYLGRGIYGEVTMLLHRQRIEPLPWTYPDYLEPPARDFFLALRDRVLPGLRNDAGRC